MATDTVGRELGGFMVRIRRLVEIGQVAAYTSVRGIAVVAVVAGGTVIGNGRVRTIERIVVVVVGKSCRRPAGLGGVAARTVVAEAQRHVVGVAGLVKISRMAACTGIRRVVVVPVVTGSTLVGNNGVPACEGVKVVMVKSGRYPCRLRVTILAVGRELGDFMVRIGRTVVVGQVAAHTGIGRVVVIAIVAGSAVISNARMRAIERVVVVVVGKSRRRPAGLGSVATGAVIAKAQRYVVGVAGLIEISTVTTCTGVGRIVVITVVAGGTFIDNNGMPPCQRVKIVVVEARRYP